MPVRLSPEGSLLLTYDEQSKTWVSLSGTSLSILNHPVDILPGTTIGHIFDIVDRDSQLKQFLGGYCCVDVDKLHARDRTRGKAVRVEAFVEDEDKDTIIKRLLDGSGKVFADTIVVKPFYVVGTDDTGARICRGSNYLFAKSSKIELSGEQIDEMRDDCFGDICSLNVVLDPQMLFQDWDAWTRKDGYLDPLKAQVAFTLFDVLTAIYEFFGDPAFDDRTAKQVDVDEWLKQQAEEYRKRKQGESEQ